MSESDVRRRHILTYKDGPGTERVKDNTVGCARKKSCQLN